MKRVGAIKQNIKNKIIDKNGSFTNPTKI